MYLLQKRVGREYGELEKQSGSLEIGKPRRSEKRKGENVLEQVCWRNYIYRRAPIFERVKMADQWNLFTPLTSIQIINSTFLLFFEIYLLFFLYLNLNNT